MTKTITELEAQAESTIEDNTLGAISAEDVRVMFLDFLEAVKPASALITLTLPLTKSLTTTPQLIAPFSAVSSADVPEFTTNIAGGSITRLLGDAAEIRSMVFAGGVVEAPSGNDVTVEIRRNGLPIGAATTLTGRGTGNYIAFSVAAFGPASTDDGIYALYANAGATANVTFRNAKLFVNKIPARG